VQIKDGANQWWFALLAKNVGGSGAVTKLEISDGNNGKWIAMERQSYNYWIATSGAGFKFPLGVRVSQNSKTVTGTISTMSAGGVFELSANFS
jgi:expansin (peptidoglycan-binding protein)